MLHTDNVILDSNGYAKLTDFGISQKLNADGFCYAGSGTRYYLITYLERIWHWKYWEVEENIM